MKSRIGRIIITAGAYTAAFAGGGFASGKEIAEYFVRHGAAGAAACAVSSAVFGIYAYAVLEICRRKQIRTSADLSREVFGKAIGTAVQWYICVFSAVMLGAMTSAAGETAWVCFGISRAAAGVILCAAASVFVIVGIRGIALWEGVLGIISAAGIIIMCRWIIHFRLIDTISFAPYVRSGVSYTGYNLLGTTAVLCGMSGYMKSRLESACAAAASFIMLALMMGMMWLTVNIFYGKIPLGSLPMLTIARRMGEAPAAVYSLIIASAVFTTAVSSAYGISDTLSARLNPRQRACIVFAAGLIIGGLGFDVIVARIYYIMGIIGFAVTAYIYMYFLRRKNAQNQGSNRRRGRV